MIVGAVLQLAGLVAALVSGWMLAGCGGVVGAGAVDAVYVGLALEQRGNG
jgi:hypothetical protein